MPQLSCFTKYWIFDSSILGRPQDMDGREYDTKEDAIEAAQDWFNSLTKREQKMARAVVQQMTARYDDDEFVCAISVPGTGEGVVLD